MRPIACFIAIAALFAPAQAFAGTVKPVVLAECIGMAPQVKPAVIVLACGDGGAGIKDLKWTDWGGDRAHARGTVWQRVCEPDCARGHDQTFPASVTVFGKQTCANGDIAYTSVKYVISRSGKPDVVTQGFSCASQ